MAQNITLMGASYPDVPAIELPKTGGGTATFADPSVTTAVESDVAAGKIFLKANGEIAVGTAGGSIPCTGIALDYNSISFDTVGEQIQVTATVTPSNTTETLTWSSSNEDVATVVNGLVTIHGIGSATITATCGNQTATAAISQTGIRAAGTFAILSGYIPYQYGDEVTLESNSGRYALGNAYSGDNTVKMIHGADLDLEMIKIPYGATTAHMATQDGNAITLDYMYIADCTDLVIYHDELYPRYLQRVADVNSNTGAAVTYGKCVAFALYNSTSSTPIYVYFT